QRKYIFCHCGLPPVHYRTCFIHLKRYPDIERMGIMKKRTLALILSALTAATVFASCSDSSGGSSAASESSASGSETAGTETGETSGDSDLREEELVTLDIVCMSYGKNEPDITDVENAMNEILEEKLNCNVDLTFIAYANYADQIS